MSINTRETIGYGGASVKSTIHQLNYRPDIDGLRAIAVLAVVFYHAGLPVSGGYVGVDVFFVISGYLITALIIKELNNSSFSLVDFWERRARRIVPALAVTVLVTLLAGWFLLLPVDYVQLGRSASFMSLFCANLFFWRTGNYFNRTTDEMPLLHTWSLAVEEQFYLVVPLALMAMFQNVEKRGERAVRLVFGGILVVSIASGLLVASRHPVAAFFLSPARAWELLLGSALAVCPKNYISNSKILREIMSWVGVSGVLTACFAYSSATPFPGLAALPVCFGTALLIWANTPTSEVQRTSTVVGRILSSRPLVFIGLISYSLYLWHWPVIAFSNYWAFGPLSISYRIGMVLVGLLLAIGSWYFVETPFRKRMLFPAKKGMLCLATITLVSICMIGSLISIFHGVPERLPGALRVAYAGDSRDDFEYVRNHSVQDINAGNVTAFGAPGNRGQISILVWGDSHAMSALPALDSICKSNFLAGRAITRTGTKPVLIDGSKDHADDWYGEATLRYIREYKIPNVILISRWDASLPANSAIEGRSELSLQISLQQNLLQTVKELVKAGSKPWIVLQVPTHPHHVPKAVAKANVLSLPEADFCAKPDARNGIVGDTDEIIQLLEGSGASLIDPRPAFLSEDRSHYIMSSNGMPLYMDAHHLNRRGAEQILIPVFSDILHRMSRNP